MIKALAFDINGVLQLGEKRHRGVHEEMAKHFKLDLDTWFDAIDTPYAKAIEGKLTKKQALSIMAKNIGSNPEKIERLFKKSYKKHFKRNARLYNLAYKLRKRGYKIILLSDQWQVSKEVLVNPKDEKKFNLSLISCNIGVRKPSKEIYKLLIKKLKLHPSEILFIDNRSWNLAPAKKLGIKTLIFKNNNQLIKSLKKLKIL